MGARIHHIVRAVSALDCVAHFWNFLLLNLKSRAQAVRAANFLDGVGGNRKKVDSTQ